MQTGLKDISRYQSNSVDTKHGKLILDSHKLSYHYDRVEAWENGERIAPITIDMALTRACNYSCGFCYAMFQENNRAVINKKVILKI